MKTQFSTVLLVLLPALTFAQVPVDDNGNVIGNYESPADIMPIGDDGIPQLSRAELQELVGPIALYPDDLLAIVLPASAYPLQIVEAARFLDALESDPTLKPDPDWDDSVVALTNYPEVIDLLNEDLDWTWRLGEAVVAQQSDVVAAVESFRDVAYAAGNLKSDDYQTVSRNDGAIRISPTAEDVIYVPYYEPARVVHYQARPAYYYYPQPYPVYYYPYSAGHYFDRGYFWGVTTAFTIGWMSDSLHVYHHSYQGHPYYGRSYWNDWWYRRPSITVYNTTYVNRSNVTVNHYSNGDRWHPRTTRREYVRREGYARNATRVARSGGSNVAVSNTRRHEPISFRERDSRERNSRVSAGQQTRQTRDSVARNTRRQDLVENTREGSRDNTYRATQRLDTSRPDAVDRSRNRATATRTAQQQVRQAREQAPARTERAQARTERAAPARIERAQARNERAPTRTERAPVRTAQAASRSERREADSRPREQSSRPQQTRAQINKDSASKPQRSERKSSESRSRSRDRKKR